MVALVPQKFLNILMYVGSKNSCAPKRKKEISAYVWMGDMVRKTGGWRRFQVNLTCAWEFLNIRGGKWGILIGSIMQKKMKCWIRGLRDLKYRKFTLGKRNSGQVASWCECERVRYASEVVRCLLEETNCVTSLVVLGGEG